MSRALLPNPNADIDQQGVAAVTRFATRLGRRQPFFATFLAVTMLAALPASRAYAQATVTPPAPYQPTDSNGVDLASGTISVPSTSIGVGQPDQGGLSYTATFISPTQGWRHSVWGGIQRKPNTGPLLAYAWYTVTVMGKSVVFTPDGFGGYQAIDGKGELTLSGTIWTFTAPDGSIATFDKNLVPGLTYIANQGPITSLVKPDGERIEWTYAANTGGTYRRLQSVNNNLGYQIHFQYDITLPTAGDKVVAVQAVNNGVDACDPAANTCTFSRTWPSLAFTYSTGQYSVTDALNRTLRVISSGGAIISGIARPTTPTGQDDTIGWGTSARGDVRVLSYSNGAGTWAYNYSPAPYPPDASSYDSWTTVTDPLGHTTKYNFYSVDPEAITGQMVTSLRSIVDPLNQTTAVIQDASGLQSVTYPEGNRVSYLQNDYGNPSGVITHPKTGADTVVSAQFDPACSTPIACRRPISITDELGNVTNLQYSAVHGGLLAQTLPAPTTGAVRPETRHSYQQIYAWYKNTAGSLIQAPTPIWREVGTSTCATLTTCAGTSDEVVTYTTYQSGSASVFSNILQLSGTTASGDGLLTATTSTTYDGVGNVETVDGPLSGTDDTTRYRYDDMRQRVGMIGPDPDGAGARLFPATRTTFNADGRVTASQRGTVTSQSDPAWAAFSAIQTAASVYNGQGQKVVDIGADGSSNPSVTQYSYDAAGRQTCAATRMNPATFSGLPASACTLATTGSFGSDRIVANTYDVADHLISVQDGFGTAVQRTVRTQAFTPNGKIDWVEDAAGNRSNYTYDAFDRLYRLEYPSPTVGAHAANPLDYEEYAYDAAGNPTGKRTRGAQNFTTTFDHLGRAILIDAPAPSNDVTYTYDNLNRRLSASHLGGQTVSVTWDALSRQTSETGPLGAMTMEYDLAGHRTRLGWPDAFSVTYTWDLGGAMTGIYQSAAPILQYSYDNAGRRTSITRGNGVTTSLAWDNSSHLTTLAAAFPTSSWDITYGFGYNPSGQVISRAMSNITYAYSATNLSQNYTNNGLNQSTLVGTSTLVWTNGNLTSDGVRSFSYDAANRLLTTGSSSLTYDPLDRLYQMTGTDGGRFIYDGGRIAGVYPAGSSTISERYVAGAGPDEWAVVYAGSSASSPSWPIQNYQSSTIALTNAAGTPTSTLAYDDYGQGRSGNTGRMQFTGQMVLPDFGLLSFKTRSYYAALGRFVQTDPVGYDQGLNLYAYAGNDPVNITDPTGAVKEHGLPGQTICDDDFNEISCAVVSGQDEGGSGQARWRNPPASEHAQAASDVVDNTIGTAAAAVEGAHNAIPAARAPAALAPLASAAGRTATAVTVLTQTSATVDDIQNGRPADEAIVDHSSTALFSLEGSAAVGRAGFWAGEAIVPEGGGIVGAPIGALIGGLGGGRIGHLLGDLYVAGKTEVSNRATQLGIAAATAFDNRTQRGGSGYRPFHTQ